MYVDICILKYARLLRRWQDFAWWKLMRRVLSCEHFSVQIAGITLSSIFFLRFRDFDFCLSFNLLQSSQVSFHFPSSPYDSCLSDTDSRDSACLSATSPNTSVPISTIVPIVFHRPTWQCHVETLLLFSLRAWAAFSEVWSPHSVSCVCSLAATQNKDCLATQLVDEVVCVVAPLTTVAPPGLSFSAEVFT